MLMKWLIRLAFPALGLLLLLIFFGLGDPEKMAQPTAVKQPEEVPRFEGLLPSPIPVEGQDIVFKWQDTDGNWHYADQPPEQGSWNALTIDQPNSSPRQGLGADADNDWQSPYSAPFSLNGTTGRNGS